MNSLSRLFRHLWLDAGDARHVLSDEALSRLEKRIAASETRHSGEICLQVEATLPVGYLWRHLRQRVPIETVVHERALAQFGRLRVWDTEYNNGVLIYLQLVEHQIEIVADRGLAKDLSTDDWQRVIAQMREDFRQGHYETGLNRAIDAVDDALTRHFPSTTSRTNQLDNRPRID